MTHSSLSDAPHQVGFIGLGKMGNLMAANLLKGGFALVVHDLRRDSATALLASGAAWADSPGEVAGIEACCHAENTRPTSGFSATVCSSLARASGRSAQPGLTQVR